MLVTNGRFTVGEIIEFCKSTELKNLDIIKSARDMSNLINMSLIEIHSLLVLNQGVVEIPMEEDKEIYNILDYIKE